MMVRFKRRRLMRLLRELDEVNILMRDNGMKAMAEVVDESAKFAIDEYNAILIALIGIPLLRRGKEQPDKMRLSIHAQSQGE